MVRTEPRHSVAGSGRWLGRIFSRHPDRWLLITAGLGAPLIGLLPALAIYAGIGEYVAAALAATATVVLLLTRPTWAVAIVMAANGLVFVEPAPVDYGISLLLVWALLTGRFSLAILSRFPFMFQIGALLFLVANVISLTAARDLGASMRFGAITVYGFLIALTLAGIGKAPRLIDAAALGYVIGATVFAGLGLAAYAGFMSDRQLYTEFRLVGFFKDPNVFGPYLVPACVMAFHAIRTVRPLVVPLGAVILLGTAVVMSFSRGAWVNLLVALATYILLTMRRPNMRQTVVSFALIVIAALALFWITDPGQVTVVGHWFAERVGVQSYDATRLQGQERGVAIALASPLGIGPGEYVAAAGIASHNLFVEVLTENGILGLVGLLLMTIALLSRLLVVGRLRVGSNAAHFLAPEVCAAAIVGIIFNSLVVDTLHWRHFWILIGFTLFVLAVHGRPNGSRSTTILRNGV